MRESKLYSIGQAAKICDVSTRTLRYYESKGLISCDYTSDSGYRYYTMATLRVVQTIRYYVDQGFSLEEAGQLINAVDTERFQEIFRKQMVRTKAEIEYYHQRLDSLKDWYSLVSEGKRALRVGESVIRTKYVDEQLCFSYEEDFDTEDPDAEANLEIRYFTSSKRDGHSMVDVGGAFTIHHNSYRIRMDGVSSKVELIQPIYPHAKSMKNTKIIPGYTAITAYHLGSIGNITDTYEAMVDWADKHEFKLKGDSYERYVLDFYSTNNEENYVTQILMPVEANDDDLTFLKSLG